MENKYITVNSSNKQIEGKVKFDINKSTDKVLWYIKFNVALDASTITSTTMAVTDEYNKLLDTNITCDPKTKLIIVQPLVSYLQDYNYILNISQKVKSANGQNLKEDVRIMFKLRGTEIYDLTVLKGSKKTLSKKMKKHQKKFLFKGKVSSRVLSLFATKKKLPIKKKAPKIESVKIQPTTLKLLHTNTRENVITPQKRKLPVAPININILVGLGGILSFVFTLAADFQMGYIISILVLIAGIFHVIMQLTGKKMRSIRLYNEAVSIYNKDNNETEKVVPLLQKSQELYPDNAYATDALRKLELFYKHSV